MEIVYFDRLDSTQTRLIADIAQKKVTPPIAYYTNNQTDGVGSRGNRWIGKKGNLFFSFALFLDALPPDLPPPARALYCTYLFKETLAQKGSHVWLKWPNDLYIEDKKCGGALCNIKRDIVVCGIGLNTKYAPPGFGTLDIQIDEKKLLEEFFSLLHAQPSWKKIFSKYKIEFQKSRAFSTHIGNEIVDLKDATVAQDGALVIKNERIYNRR